MNGRGPDSRPGLFIINRCLAVAAFTRTAGAVLAIAALSTGAVAPRCAATVFKFPIDCFLHSDDLLFTYADGSRIEILQSIFSLLIPNT